MSSVGTFYVSYFWSMSLVDFLLVNAEAIFLGWKNHNFVLEYLRTQFKVGSRAIFLVKQLFGENLRES